MFDFDIFPLRFFDWIQKPILPENKLNFINYDRLDQKCINCKYFSYMNSDDEESNRSYDNRNKKGKRVQYADTSISSDPDYNEMDEYLDEAMSDDIGEEEEEEDNDEDGARYHGKDAKVSF